MSLEVRHLAAARRRPLVEALPFPNYVKDYGHNTRTIQQFRFDARDEAGRQIGCEIVRRKMIVDRAPASWQGARVALAAGNWFLFQPRPTRNGEGAGFAWQQVRYFQNEEARERELAAY